MYICATDIMCVSRNPVKIDHMKKNKTIRKKTASSTSSITHTIAQMRDQNQKRNFQKPFENLAGFPTLSPP